MPAPKKGPASKLKASPDIEIPKEVKEIPIETL